MFCILYLYIYLMYVFKCWRMFQKEKHDAVEYAVYSGCNEKFLEVFVSKEKGRGIRTLKEFRKNEFVVEYKGRFDFEKKKQQELR